MVILGVTIAITLPSIRHQLNLITEIMKTTEPNKNNIKNNKMYRLAFLFTVLISITATASIDRDCNTLNNSLNSELHNLEKIIFVNAEDSISEIVDVNDVEVIEIEEEVVINFDTKTYLSEDFNALKGMYNLDSSLIEVIELEEEVELGFDTSKYLPKNFNALKGKHDLDWNAIELIEIEEDVDLGFDTQKYLPQGFDAHQGEHI